MSQRRKPPKFKAGDVRGVFVVLDGGRPEALAKDRVVRVRCTRCEAVDILTENWLARRESLNRASCYSCRDTSNHAWARHRCARGILGRM